MFKYVLTTYRHETDCNELCQNLGVDGRKSRALNERKIILRAAWANDLKGQIIPKEAIRN